MKYEHWLSEFQPLSNPFRSDSAIDGHAFEPFGDEYEFVRKQPPENVWTFIVCDGQRSSSWLIANGFHSVNRMGYLITVRPCPAGRAIDVKC